MRIAPGEGERRAQSGYVPQYEIAARLIYERIASGELVWIGVADRSAGIFDDIVIGLRDRVLAYQMKSSDDSSDFSLRTLLLGASGILERTAEARTRLKSSLPPETIIETVFITRKLARSTDTLIANGVPISTAAYLRAHTAYAKARSIEEWQASDQGEFVSELLQASGLDKVEFEDLWRQSRFITGADPQAFGIEFASPDDERRIRQLADLLPHLVAHKPGKDRWRLEELLAKLRWEPAFTLRHTHTFPVDALYESNEATQTALNLALHSYQSGYVALVGPPGCGKSTLLAAGILPGPRSRVLRYLAFVPGRGQGLGRAEAFDFLGDLVRQFKQQGLGRDIVPGNRLPELQAQLIQVLSEASEEYKRNALRSIVIVDGLDHVPREERPSRSFLSELPLPQTIPEGVLFLLGTQKLELADLPDSVTMQASEPGRLIQVASLSPTNVARIAELAHLPEDVPIAGIYEKSQGHPLATRYIIDSLLKIADVGACMRWLREEPVFGGDIDVFYSRAWRELSRFSEATLGLEYLSLIEAPISPLNLDKLITSNATDALWRAAGHLFRKDSAGDWSLFHNSFRLFLRSKFGVRHGLPNQERLNACYRELAELASGISPHNEQRWLEFRYWMRASEFSRALSLGKPGYFREQFLHGRPADQIREDLGLSFAAIRALQDTRALVSTILAIHELTMRLDAVNDDLVDALIALGHYRHAQSLILADGTGISSGKGFDLVEALLNEGLLADAKGLFVSLEPLEYLFGRREWNGLTRAADSEMERWANLVLAFRTPRELLTTLSRVQAKDLWASGEEADTLDTQPLRVLAARGHLMRNPEYPLCTLQRELSINSDYGALLRYFALRSAVEAGNLALAQRRCKRCCRQKDEFSPRHLLRIAEFAVQLSMIEEARALLLSIERPSLILERGSYGDAEIEAVQDLLRFNSMRAQLELPDMPSGKPKAQLLVLYQKQLENISHLHGSALRGDDLSIPISAAFTSFLDFVERAEGTERPDFDRGLVSRSMHCALPLMLDAAFLQSRAHLDELVAEIDGRLDRDARHLGNPSFRHAYVRSLLKYDRDPERVRARIRHHGSLGNRTPSEELSSIAESAKTYIAAGMREDAAKVLTQVGTHGLGISRPAKKDPQYLFWESCLRIANKADPSQRASRVKFIARFLSGLAESEGAGAASRVVGTFMEEAAQVSPELSDSLLDMVEERDLSSWAEIVDRVAMGVAVADSSLASLCSVLIGRLSIPFFDCLDYASFDRLVELAPTAQVEQIAQRLTVCIETDAPLQSRILALEKVIDAARRRSVSIDTLPLYRWQQELLPPSSGSSPEDPFFLARSLSDVAKLLDIHRNSHNTYGARQAFIRALEWEDHKSAMELLKKEQILLSDEQVLEAVARKAFRAGVIEDVDFALEALLAIVGERGSWGGGWHSESKLRYFSVRKELGHVEGSKAIFDAFVDDCSAGREQLDHLPPNLPEVLLLFDDMVAWPDVWDALEDHLKQFREYQAGLELTTSNSMPLDGLRTLGNLVSRALSTTASALNDAARAAAVELCNAPRGEGLVGPLVLSLIAKGGEGALEGAQIFWSCRKLDTMAVYHARVLDELRQSMDFAILLIACRISGELGKPCELQRVNLPQIYSLELPNDGPYLKYEMPSGFSQTSSGLFSEDYASWTWILEKQIGLVSDASGLPAPNIRYRIGQLMNDLGGPRYFGPEAVKAQMARLNKLSLHMGYVKLTSQAALIALRSAIGELVKANAIDAYSLSLLEAFSGAQGPLIPARFPVPRPATIRAHTMFQMFLNEDAAWIENAKDDLIVPNLKDWLVLAAVSTCETGYRNDHWISDRYFGPALKTADDLFEYLQGLPGVLLTDQASVTYRRPSLGAVAYVRHTLPGVEVCPLLFCPLVAKALKWEPSSEDAFVLLSPEGQIAAKVLHWRDGGFRTNETDRIPHSHGFAVLLNPAFESQVRPFFADKYVVRAWRRKQTAGFDVEGSAEAQNATQPQLEEYAENGRPPLL